MDSIHVTFADGNSVDVRPGIRVVELAAAAGAKNLVAAKVDGQPVDLNRTLDKDCSVAWVTPDSADGLDVIRHSTAHLMAQAVQSLFPGTQVTIGPTIAKEIYKFF